MKKVMVFGTFNHLHPGHINFFTQAKKLADYLIVVVATDTNVKKAKGKLPSLNQFERLKEVQTSKLVNRAILGSEDMDYLTTIKNETPDIISLGYDQTFSLESLQQELLAAGIPTKIVRLHPYHPEKYKSSLLKKSK